MTLAKTTSKSVEVDQDYFWQPLNICPLGVKVQLLGLGKVASYGMYDGKDPFWKAWAPLPKIGDDILALFPWHNTNSIALKHKFSRLQNAAG